jgi:hypothetical protein
VDVNVVPRIVNVCVCVCVCLAISNFSPVPVYAAAYMMDGLHKFEVLQLAASIGYGSSIQLQVHLYTKCTLHPRVHVQLTMHMHVVPQYIPERYHNYC